jgi:hypothetical protein
MHGANDSEKKTNTQKLLMEFISLASLDFETMLTPNKLLWLSTKNSPTTLLLYIFNPDDLKGDMRQIRSHKSLEEDKESISRHKIPLDETSPLSTVKTGFQDILMSQQRRNLCMSYMSVGDNMDDFIKKHIEFGLSKIMLSMRIRHDGT